jgi:hypothetical protein
MRGEDMGNKKADEFEARMKEFVADRDAALLSMDKEKLIAYGNKWGVNWKLVPGKEVWFWVSVHMARTGATSLPSEERIKSKKWLRERGLRSMDEDLP